MGAAQTATVAALPDANSALAHATDAATGGDINKTTELDASGLALVPKAVESSQQSESEIMRPQATMQQHEQLSDVIAATQDTDASSTSAAPWPDAPASKSTDPWDLDA